jgi:hypothetical protein
MEERTRFSGRRAGFGPIAVLNAAEGSAVTGPVVRPGGSRLGRHSSEAELGRGGCPGEGRGLVGSRKCSRIATKTSIPMSARSSGPPQHCCSRRYSGGMEACARSFALYAFQRRTACRLAMPRLRPGRLLEEALGEKDVAPAVPAAAPLEPPELAGGSPAQREALSAAINAALPVANDFSVVRGPKDASARGESLRTSRLDSRVGYLVQAEGPSSSDRPLAARCPNAQSPYPRRPSCRCRRRRARYPLGHR